MKQKDRIRFIDIYGNPLFELPSGESIVTITLEESCNILQCTAIDAMHFKVGYYKMQIHHFAQLMSFEATRYHPLDTGNNSGAAYYELLRPRVKRMEDSSKERTFIKCGYSRYYQGMLAPSIRPRDIRIRHTNPFIREILPSLQKDDLIVVHRDGKKDVFQMRHEGLINFPGFFQKE